jgi:hypothetical protein
MVLLVPLKSNWRGLAGIVAPSLRVNQQALRALISRPCSPQPDSSQDGFSLLGGVAPCIWPGKGLAGRLTPVKRPFKLRQSGCPCRSTPAHQIPSGSHGGFVMAKPFTMTKVFSPLYHGGMEKPNAPAAQPFDYDDASIWRLVPYSIREIAEHIGRKSAVELCTSFGGENISIPMRDSRKGAEKFKLLADAIGQEAANKLCFAYGGVRLSIPTMNTALRAVRARCVERFVALRVSEGLSQRAANNEAARRFGVTSRCVEIHISKAI